MIFRVFCSFSPFIMSFFSYHLWDKWRGSGDNFLVQIKNKSMFHMLLSHTFTITTLQRCYNSSSFCLFSQPEADRSRDTSSPANLVFCCIPPQLQQAGCTGGGGITSNTPHRQIWDAEEKEWNALNNRTRWTRGSFCLSTAQLIPRAEQSSRI